MFALSTRSGKAYPLRCTASLLLCFLINLNEIWSFNLDSFVPIIKTSSINSYFGFSVAQHYISENNQNAHVIIVGAPRGNVSTLPSVVEPGAVFRCPLSASNIDCTRIVIDEVTSAGIDKSNQWLGVSVSSQNTADGLALTCAHRYKLIDPSSKRSFVWGQGICFSLDNSLTELNSYEPCNGKPLNRGHEQYGTCQAGTSVAIHKNGDMLFGTPGPLVWTGTLFKYSVVDYAKEETPWYESDSEDRVPYNSYLGMAVRIGENIFEDGSLAFIGSAPKSRGTGEVIFFRQGPYAKLNAKLLFVYRLLGDQFCSGFGYDIIVGDFNGDGKSDVVIGAPFYNGRGIGGAIYIYFNSKGSFTSKPTKITSRTMKDAECESLRCYDARFGFALTTIGDLDRDGYQDFVVGAPFEGNGAIYIFRGSPTSKIDSYSQRIAAADIRGFLNLKSFGYSLSGGSDIDNNTYPDLTIGAYQSDAVVILRARPVVNIEATLESNPKQIDPKQTNCSDGKQFNCLSITVCLKFNAEPKDRYTGRLNIKYHLEAEKFTETNVVPIFFGNDAENYFVENTVSMKEQNKQAYECASHIAYLRTNNWGFLSPVVFRLTYELPDSRPPTPSTGQPLPQFYSYPVLNQTTRSKDLHIFAESTSIDATNSQENNTVISGQDDVSASDLRLSATLQLPQDSNTGEYLLKLGEVPEIRLSVTVTNNGEDAHETALWVSLPDNINMIGIESKDKELSCTPVDNNRKLECVIGNPVAREENVSIVIRLNPNQLTRAQNKITIGVSLNTTSSQKNLSADHINLQIAVTTIIDLAVIGCSDPGTVYYQKDVEQKDYKPTNEEDIGPEVVHKFEVKNTGKVIVEQSDLTITWPMQVINSANQKLHLLYIMETSQVKCNTQQQEGARCTIDPKFVNPDNVKVKVSNPDSIKEGGSDAGKQVKRTKRETKENYEAGIGDWVCGKSSSIICASIKCKVLELRPAERVLISIRSRLWNRTISSTFPDAYKLSLRSTARITVDQEGLNIKQSNTRNDVGQAGTNLFSSEKKPDVVAPWIIILSVSAGCILLFCLIILLWRCGFFKRNRPNLTPGQPQYRALVKKSAEEEEAEDRDAQYMSLTPDQPQYSALVTKSAAEQEAEDRDAQYMTLTPDQPQYSALVKKSADEEEKEDRDAQYMSLTPDQPQYRALVKKSAGEEGAEGQDAQYMTMIPDQPQYHALVKKSADEKEVEGRDAKYMSLTTDQPQYCALVKKSAGEEEVENRDAQYMSLIPDQPQYCDLVKKSVTEEEAEGRDAQYTSLKL